MEALNASHYIGVAKQVRRRVPGEHQRWEAAQAAERRRWEDEQQERQRWDEQQQQREDEQQERQQRERQEQEEAGQAQWPPERTQWISPFQLDQQQGQQHRHTSSPLLSLPRSLATPPKSTPSVRGCTEHMPHAAEGQGRSAGAAGAVQQPHLLRLPSRAGLAPSPAPSPLPHTPDVSPVHADCGHRTH